MKENRHDKRDRNSEENQLRAITRYAEDIQDLISNADSSFTESEKAKYTKTIGHIRNSYENLTGAFLNGRRGLKEEELDEYFKLGSKISQLSYDLIKLIKDNDIKSQNIIYSTCDLIEQTADKLTGLVESRDIKAA